ncbi:UDP-N-acetylmuramoyl-tripeptide--D-alanyl-D-alanine ligase [Chitinimonas sp. BJB300]|uniref:UDP-N-acetylmuramoyl-tripeptide--D-alanyl-D- alanine ligase n=1 Tax=Chitinimonas sp. BJB300 TaxID=1559339 RepID=UPI000C10952E|nr:UDP-N-acetylmuramoyl-tripeptide--D-alanyl-D-alanine ligase [Chitinimonas sp. BJB300]PHV12770.1 UDP-N-acetylmuramoyl-tripeptide--D-alanyl-D-alanine ligase [Chitinimonas sp. BJB300]TSJ91360.1 UDP-N-acetylmuramoyl-tripeptide--D-alanyl-D-alanine ligase [Chitinimonas sp. BJB300]
MSKPILTLSVTASAVNGQLQGEAAASFTRVSTDSRDIQTGDLFVALRGDRFDGHDYAVQALAQGAACVLVENGRLPELTGNRIEVDDTLAALGHLAAYWRQQFNIPVIGITGSNGKTSVKEMLATILRNKVGEQAVLATAGNMNNHIGLPLMLMRLTAEHQYAVLELGMNHFGEISYLTKIAKPDVALLNNAGSAHLEFLGSIEGVARAKGEIFEGLASDGVAILNGDDIYAPLWRELANHRTVLDFGLHSGNVHAADVQLKPLESHFQIVLPAGTAAVKLQVPGEHNVRNALAAASVAVAMGLMPDEIATGLNTYVGTKGRLQQKRASNGALVIDDSYNANPNSMHAAVDVLAVQPGKRLLVLGDMGEIGVDIAERHREIGVYARQQGIERLFAVGEQMQQAVAGFGDGANWFANHTALLVALRTELTPSTTVVVKGSRFMQMERVVNALTQPAAGMGEK